QAKTFCPAAARLVTGGPAVAVLGPVAEVHDQQAVAGDQLAQRTAPVGLCRDGARDTGIVRRKQVLDHQIKGLALVVLDKLAGIHAVAVHAGLLDGKELPCYLHMDGVEVDRDQFLGASKAQQRCHHTAAAKAQHQNALDARRLDKKCRQPEQVPDTAGKKFFRMVFGVLYAIGQQAQALAVTAHFVMHAVTFLLPDYCHAWLALSVTRYSPARPSNTPCVTSSPSTTGLAINSRCASICRSSTSTVLAICARAAASACNWSALTVSRAPCTSAFQAARACSTCASWRCASVASGASAGINASAEVAVVSS